MDWILQRMPPTWGITVGQSSFTDDDCTDDVAKNAKCRRKSDAEQYCSDGTKLRIYETCVLNKALYGSEVWTLLNQDLCHLEAFHRGSPVGAVGLALHAVNEVKLCWARLQLGWVTRLHLSFNWTLVVG